MPRSRRSACPDSEFVEAVYRHTPAGTREVAETVGISRVGAYKRLRQLEAEGQVYSKKIGQVRVWCDPAVTPE